VRQPLIQLTYQAGSTGQQMDISQDIYKNIIADELNVKNIEINFGIGNVADVKLSLNNQILGKRLPALMKQIIPASKKGEWKQVDGTVEICGEKLLPEEYTLQLEPKPEYADRAQALSTNDALVILDTTITPDLLAEGIARDMVRAIQQARKDADLHVSDRIRLHLSAPDDVANAVRAHKQYILEQTLSTELLENEPEQKIFSTQADIDDKQVTINLSSAA
ncbi:MAG: DUF5915 domain-containing protein, partial [Alphaproteobacteria bacterium]